MSTNVTITLGGLYHAPVIPAGIWRNPVECNLIGLFIYLFYNYIFYLYFPHTSHVTGLMFNNHPTALSTTNHHNVTCRRHSSTTTTTLSTESLPTHQQPPQQLKQQQQPWWWWWPSPPHMESRKGDQDGRCRQGQGLRHICVSSLSAFFFFSFFILY